MDTETLLLEIKRTSEENHSKLFAEVSRIRETQAVIAQRTEDNHKTLHGNGKLGLKDQQKEDTNNINKKIDNQWYKTLLGFALITSGGTASGVGLFRMLSTLFKVA